MNWREQAACKGTNLDWFFDDRHDRQATAICHTCPAREHCLNYALELGPDLPGIYGGLTQQQRRRLLTPRDKGYTHGTVYGYRVHRCRCQPCRDAHAKSRAKQRHAHT